MPKTNYAGATYAGHEGIVENAVGELSQLDPSRNVDGSVVDGFESDERELDEREEVAPYADPTGVSVVDKPEANAAGSEASEEEQSVKPEDTKPEEPKVASKRGTPKSPTSTQRTAGRKSATRTPLPGK
jgi:hypothetical protein